MGGADQWGNITAGLELIRRVEGHDPTGVERAHGLSYPLLLDATGQKFGKTTEGTAVWLDPGRTSPYTFYQFWLDRDDAEVGRLLRMFTLFELGEIEAIETDSVSRPEARLGQRALARDLTQRVHGPEILERVTTVSAAVFSRTLPSLGPEALAYAFEQLPNSVVGPDALVGGPVGLAVAAGLFSSNGAARRTISQGGLSINEIRVESVDDPLPALLSGNYLVMRSGKKTYRIVRVASG
jgi:tyrosyl-tRNA synthetase